MPLHSDKTVEQKTFIIIFTALITIRLGDNNVRFRFQPLVKIRRGCIWSIFAWFQLKQLELLHPVLPLPITSPDGKFHAKTLYFPRIDFWCPILKFLYSLVKTIKLNVIFSPEMKSILISNFMSIVRGVNHLKIVAKALIIA